MMIAALLLNPALAQDAGYGIRCADISCASCEAAPIERVDADSALTGSYGPKLAFDGDLSTAWCEGAAGTGVNQSINITLSEPKVIEAILIHGGYFKSASLLAANGRIHAMNMVAGDSEGPQIRADFSFQDPSVIPANDPCAAPGESAPLTATQWFSNTRAASGALVWRSDGDAQTVTEISFTIDDVYPGAKYEDTCISEIQVIVRE